MLYKFTDKVQLTLTIKAKNLLSLMTIISLDLHVDVSVSMTPCLDQLTSLQCNKVQSSLLMTDKTM